MSITSKKVPFMFLKQVLSLTKFISSNVSLRSEKWLLGPLFESRRFMFQSPATKMFS